MNSQKSTETKKYSFKRLGGLTAVLLFLLAAAAASCLWIRRVNVKNNVTYTGEQAEALVFPEKIDRNTAVCFVKQKLMKHPELPLIAQYKVEFVSLTECDLILYEKTVAGCIEYMSSYMYFDRDGMIVENAQERIRGVPLIKGVRFDDIALGRKLFTDRPEVFTEILNITQQFSEHGLGCEKIDVSDLNHLTVYLPEGDIRVLLGSNQDLSAKAAALAGFLPKLREGNRRGVVDLSEYSDTSSSNVSYFREEK